MKEQSLRSDTLGSEDNLMVSSPCSDPQAKITTPTWNGYAKNQAESMNVSQQLCTEHPPQSMLLRDHSSPLVKSNTIFKAKSLLCTILYPPPHSFCTSQSPYPSSLQNVPVCLFLSIPKAASQAIPPLFPPGVPASPLVLLLPLPG